MKTNGEYSGYGGYIKSNMYQSWANYHLKFLDAYKNDGISFWGITTGNEPSLALVPFIKINSVAWNAPQMVYFCSYYSYVHIFSYTCYVVEQVYKWEFRSDFKKITTQPNKNNVPWWSKIFSSLVCKSGI